MATPLQWPSGWQLSWWKMMLYGANERGLCRSITPVQATTFNQAHGRTYAQVGEQKSKQTQGGWSAGLPIHPLPASSLTFFLPSAWALSRICFNSEKGGVRSQIWASLTHTAPSTSAVPSCLGEHGVAPPKCGQYNEPAAAQAAEIMVEEAKSFQPGIHIVAALQWDRSRQISSWWEEGRIW